MFLFGLLLLLLLLLMLPTSYLLAFYIGAIFTIEI